jgi:hypothetical protein
MWWIFSLLAFGIAAIIAIAGIPGISLTVIVGIIAVGLFFLALESGGWVPRWGPRTTRPGP